MYTKDEHVNYLQIKTSSPAIGQSVIFEQRLKYAKDFEKLLHGKGIDATVTTNGIQQRIVTISGNIINRPSVY
jgi:hypothetical protein